VAKFAESNVDDQVRVQLKRRRNVARADRHAFQLILHVPFVENVRVRSLLLKLGVCERDFALDSLIDREWLTRVRSLWCQPGRGEVTPQRLRVYINSPPSSDFSDLEDMKPHLDVALQNGEAGVVEYPLRAPALCVSLLSLTL